MSLLQGKTPFSLLNEICSKRSKSCHYLETENPNAGAGVFSCVVYVDATHCIAEGKSKKAAKHLAAIKMLKQILLQDPKYSNASESSIDRMFNINNNNVYNNTIDNKENNVEDQPYMIFKENMNYIDILQIKLQNERKSLPIYTFEFCEKLPSKLVTTASYLSRHFVCTCKHGVHQSTARGLSKKESKQSAAFALLKILQVPRATSNPEPVAADSCAVHVPVPATVPVPSLEMPICKPVEQKGPSDTKLASKSSAPHSINGANLTSVERKLSPVTSYVAAEKQIIKDYDPEFNYISQIQIYLQSAKRTLPTYRILNVTCHDDDIPTACTLEGTHFTCTVTQEDHLVTGCGNSKKISKHRAAYQFYEKYINSSKGLAAVVGSTQPNTDPSKTLPTETLCDQVKRLVQLNYDHDDDDDDLYDSNEYDDDDDDLYDSEYHDDGDLYDSNDIDEYDDDGESSDHKIRRAYSATDQTLLNGETRDKLCEIHVENIPVNKQPEIKNKTLDSNIDCISRIQQKYQQEKRTLPTYNFRTIIQHSDKSMSCNIAVSHFMCTISQGDCEVNGCGTSMKQSKRNAATAFCDKYMNNASPIITFSKTTHEPVANMPFDQQINKLDKKGDCVMKARQLPSVDSSNKEDELLANDTKSIGSKRPMQDSGNLDELDNSFKSYLCKLNAKDNPTSDLMDFNNKKNSKENHYQDFIDYCNIKKIEFEFAEWNKIECGPHLTMLTYNLNNESLAITGMGKTLVESKDNACKRAMQLLYDQDESKSFISLDMYK